MKALVTIQNELKAPKAQYNAFGKYNYRNAEDILEALKPLLLKHNCILFLSDEITHIEGRHYVKTTATFIDSDGSTISVSAYAREEQDKKGMDGSQITGASSSYARKYALNGLFLIDDTKDSDTTNQTEKEPKRKEIGQETRKVEQPVVFDVEGVREFIKTLKTREELNANWKQNKELQSNPDYVEIIQTRIKEIKDATEQK